MIFESLVPVIGLPFVLSVGHCWIAGRILHRSIVSALVFVPCLLHWQPLFAWLFIGAIAILLRVIGEILRENPDQKLNEGLGTLLDRVILSMKAGRPLKISLKDCARELSPPLADRLREIADRLDFGASDEGLPSPSRAILEGFRRVSEGSARSIERLESWRRSVRLRDEFRRKSGQVTLQIRAQAALASALFLPALAWNFFAGGEGAWVRAVIATLLFGAAQGWIHLFFRRFRWTI